MSKDNKTSLLKVAVVLDKRQTLINDTHSIKIRITQKGKQHYFPTGLEQVTKEFYDMAYQPRPEVISKQLREVLKEVHNLKERITAIEEEAKKVCKDLPMFTPESFRKAFYKNATTSVIGDVFSVFNSHIQKLKDENSIGTAKSYEGVMLSIAAYCNNGLREHRNSKFKGKKKEAVKLPKLQFEEITIQWLKRYAAELEALGTSNATIGIYTRSLRTIYNEAMKDNDILRTIYPFGKGKFEIPTATKNKRSLSIDSILSIIDYIPQSKPEERAKDLWLFSYFSGGANIADVIKLKHSQVQFHNQGCSIKFLRQKTKRKADKTEILIELDEEVAEYIRAIIERHGNKNKEGYVFPYLNDKVTSQEQYKAKISLIRVINKALQRIAEALKLPIDLTTYVARHSYATVLLRANVNLAQISKNLGHSNIKTTENYLGSFSSESNRKSSTALLGIRAKKNDGEA